MKSQSVKVATVPATSTAAIGIQFIARPLGSRLTQGGANGDCPAPYWHQNLPIKRTCVLSPGHLRFHLRYSPKRETKMAVQRFQGTDKYVATDDLRIAVNASIALERPLLVKGEPGTGKTELAFQVADFLKAPLITWHVKSTTKAMQGLYEYDAVTRLRDGQLGDERVHDIANYIRPGKLWDAFEADT